MTGVERYRETLTDIPTSAQLRARLEEGWRPIAIEWERQVAAERTSVPRHDVPYGLRVSQDGRHLEEEPKEQETLKLMLALIAGDHPLSKVAQELNRKGYRSRRGTEWNQVSVFNLLPRLIDVAPGILTDEEWSPSKERILRSV